MLETSSFTEENEEHLGYREVVVGKKKLKNRKDRMSGGHGYDQVKMTV